MDLDFLARTLQKWETDGSIRPGEGIIVGRHQPAPIPGAVRVTEPEVVRGRFTIEAFNADATWSLLRRYDTESEAARFVFTRLGDLVAERYWGADERERQRRDVEIGAALRTVAMLLVPHADLPLDRWDLVERLRDLGMPPDGCYWVEGVDGLPPPAELVWQLRRDDEGLWQVGVDERGTFREDGRFSVEAHACQWLLRTILAPKVVSMGTGRERPFIRPEYRDAVRAALRGALELVAGSERPA
jgi:hypothetical protein